MRERVGVPVNASSPWTVSASESDAYERYRPRYPDALFHYLSDLVQRHDRAWDCGAGPGQVSRGLSLCFDQTVATDRSVQQLRAGSFPVSVARVACDSERVALHSDSVDLVAIGQALHWFATNAFFHEVGRIARAGAVVAAWTYGLLRISDAIDRELTRFHDHVVRDHWPPERTHVDRAYQSIDFPFAEIVTPHFVMSDSWSLDHLLGYVRTWSAVRRARAVSGRDPVETLAHALAPIWGSPDESRDVQWPLTVRAGRVA